MPTVTYTSPVQPRPVEQWLSPGSEEDPIQDERGGLAVAPVNVTEIPNDVGDSTDTKCEHALENSGLAQAKISPAAFVSPITHKAILCNLANDGASKQDRPINSYNKGPAFSTLNDAGNTPDSAAGGSAGRMGRVCPTELNATSPTNELGHPPPNSPHPEPSSPINDGVNEPVTVIRLCFWDVISDDPDSLKLLEPMQPLIDEAFEEALSMLNNTMPIAQGRIIDTRQKYLAALAVLPFCPKWQCGVSSPVSVLCFSTYAELNHHHMLVHGGCPMEGYHPTLNVRKTARLLKLLTVH